MQAHLGCFAVRRGEIGMRIDPTFYSIASRLHLSRFPLATIISHFHVRDGDHSRLPDEEIVSAADGGVRYLRAQDLKDGDITADDPIYITRRYYESAARSHIRPGYLLFSIMGSIGNLV
jgi:hypothetical protein